MKRVSEETVNLAGYFSFSKNRTERIMGGVATAVTWLGDTFHEDGLSASVNATILEMTPRVKAAMFEIK